MVTYQYNAFLSHNSKDKDIVKKLARQLRDNGLKVWLDSWNLIPGNSWQEDLEQALKESRTIIVAIGEAGFGKWENEETRAVINDQVGNSSHAIIPVLLPGSKEEFLKEKIFLNRYTWVDFRNGLDNPEAFHNLISGIRQEEPGDSQSMVKASPTTTIGQNPLMLFSETRIPFTNRQDEIDAIKSTSSAQYYLIYAPSGYGKSNLLQELDNIIFEEKKWHHAYVPVSKDNSLTDIAVCLGNKLKINLDAQNAPRPGLRLGGALNNYYSAHSENHQGLVLLIDLDKELSTDILKKILDEFIPDIQRTLNTLRQFNNGEMPFRVILAGRYLAMTEEVKSTNLPLDHRALAPFTHAVVKKTIDKYLSDHTLEERHKLAAHIIYMTGGHPACIAKMLGLFKSQPIPADEFIETCKKEIRAVINSTADEVYKSLPKGDSGFTQALEALMVFRHVNFSVLDSLRIKYKLEIKDTHDFEDLLTKNYLFTRKQPFILQDDVVRRLISTHLRDYRPERFAEYCKQARENCEEILQGQDVQSPTEWTLEYLFQWLQEKSINKIDTEESRKNLRLEFFADALPTALNLYLGRHSILSQGKCREDQRALLNELGQIRQWEFEFSVTYFLRTNAYNTSLYKELEESIEKFFENKRKEIQK